MSRRRPEGSGISRARRRVLLVALVLLVLALGGALASRAAADPVPQPSAGAAPADPTAAPSPSAGADRSSAQPTPAPTSTPAARDPEKEKTEEHKDKAEQQQEWRKRTESFRKNLSKGGVLGAFEVTDRHGIPISAYQVTAETGDWSEWDLKVGAFFVDNLFFAIKWMIAFSCWLIAWALSFQLAAILLKPALTVSQSLYTNVLVQLGMPTLFLTVSGVVAAWHWMFGDRSRGWGEVAASLVISALAITTFTSPPTLLLGHQDGAVGKARALGVEVAAIVMDTDGRSLTRRGPDGTSAFSRPITDKLVDAFVIQPSMMLSYGQVFTGKCATQYTQSRVGQALFLSLIDKQVQRFKDQPATWGNFVPGMGEDLGDFLRDRAVDYAKEHYVDDDPGEKFEKACVKGNVAELKKASTDKIGGALFMLLAAFLVFLLILLLAGTYLIAQVWVAIEAMLARCALVIGILPGSGRSFLWARAASIARSLALLVLVVVALAAFIVTVTAVVSAKPTDIPGGITIRFFVIDLLCVAAIIFRRRLVRASRGWAGKAKARMNASKFGGSTTPSGLGSPPAKRGGAWTSMVGMGLMVGAMAATGGTSTTLSSGMRLGTGGVRGLRTARVVGGGIARTGRAVGRVADGGVRAGVQLTRVGLQSTIGLPVYGPRAARRVTAAAQAVPGQVTSAATQLRERLTEARDLYEPQVRSFAEEYRRGIGGNWIAGRVRSNSPTPPAAVRPRRSGPSRPANPRPAPPAPGTPRGRAQLVPQRPAVPPASARQADLQQRLHRIRTRNATARPQLPPAPRPRTAPRPRPGGRPR
ncbi:hypothetical protein AB0I82_35890 [Streptomyces sp. NPDC050315]|uniref:hypothetical protein n=1 Tax=Streptomyces sp. NPDC050315 TaxID=3155039 RepID=UPI00341EB0F4